MKVLIAGASGGIGRYLAENLSQVHEVIGSYNSRKPEHECSYTMHKVDITCENEVAAWVKLTCSADDQLALIYCVGVNYNCMMHKSDSKKWKEVIESNLIGVQHVLMNILPLMRVKKFGRIILLSSVVPQLGVPGTSAYASSKSALWGLSRSIAIENAPYGITINSLNLGYFRIGMITEIPSQVLEKIICDIPVGLLGDPVNILNAVHFILLSDYVTGSQISINGGLI